MRFFIAYWLCFQLPFIDRNVVHLPESPMGTCQGSTKYHSAHFFMLICDAVRIVDDSSDVSTSLELSAEEMTKEWGIFEVLLFTCFPQWIRGISVLSWGNLLIFVWISQALVELIDEGTSLEYQCVHEGFTFWYLRRIDWQVFDIFTVWQTFGVFVLS